MAAERELLLRLQQIEGEAEEDDDTVSAFKISSDKVSSFYNVSMTEQEGTAGRGSALGRGRSQVPPAWMTAAGGTAHKGEGEQFYPMSSDEMRGEYLASGRVRSRVLPAWMTVPGGHDNDAMESSKRQRILESSEDPNSVAINQFEDVSMPSAIVTTSSSAANSAAALKIADALHKRKASLMESTDSSILQSESELRRSQTIRAVKYQLSAFLSELHRLVGIG
mmetsp:Transcript_14418/g.19770  ORF Transcript_14418/g.19770 Transcript_14418/m.19770 type:complete len:223 (+) Transcript_14418:234-902(+)